MVDSFQAPKVNKFFREVASESNSHRSPTHNLTDQIKEETIEEQKETLQMTSMVGLINDRTGKSFDQEFDVTSAYYAQSADVTQ